MRNYHSLFNALPSFHVGAMAASVIAGAAFLIGPAAALADPPFGNLFKRGTAGNSAPAVQELRPEHGPWLIFASSFEGSNAKTKAYELANDLQKDFGLTTFVMPKKFDFTELVPGSGIREDGRQKVMKYRDAKVKEGYAVLVGEFDSTESPSLKSTLDNVKSLKPKSLSDPNGPAEKAETDPIKAFKNSMRSMGKEKTPGPLQTAFVTRNPMLPADFFQAPEMEKLVYELNQEPGYNEFSLLNCKGKYSVRVATFRGEDSFVSWGRANENKSGDNGEEMTELEKAAERAYMTVKALRAAGYEAYQFHDVNQSIVAVGSFDELGSTDANNQFVFIQGIQEIVSRFGPSSVVKNTNDYGVNFGPAVQPRLLYDLVDQKLIPELNQGTQKEKLDYFRKLSIGFDMRPTPMAVPRYKTSRIYAGSILGRR
jgi:hypothetical protein